MSQRSGSARRLASTLFFDIPHDLRYAWRMLRKSRGFALVTTMTLAIAIGANTTIFTVFDQVALRPLEIKDATAVVDIYQNIRGNVPRTSFGGLSLFSLPEYETYRAENHVFSDMVAYMPELHGTLTDTRQEITGQLVTCNVFGFAGAHAVLGRTLNGEDCSASGNGDVVVLSNELWRTAFNTDATIVGKTVRINRVPLTVVGVASPEFDGLQIIPAQFWAPITLADRLVNALHASNLLHSENIGFVAVLGRLKAGVSIAEARADLGVIASRIDQHTPGRTTSLAVNVATLFGRPDMHRVIVSVGAVLLGAVGLVLLIACANIANLMLARATARSGEIAMRVALGASRLRLIRQLLIESVLLSIIGGAIGFTLSSVLHPVLLHTLSAHIPAGGPSLHAVGPDWRILCYAFGLTLVTGIAFGLAPAIQATSLDLNGVLKRDAGNAASSHSNWLRSTLVGSQITVCMVLLIAAGLLLRALYHAQSIDPGYDIVHVGAVNYRLGNEGYSVARAAAFNRDVAERVRSLPGVESVANAGAAPLAEVAFVSSIHLPGEAQREAVHYNLIGAGFFSTTGIPLVAGRDFTRAEVSTGAPVVVVSEATARKLWPGQNPLGKRIAGGLNDKEAEVIGVAKDVDIAGVGTADRPYLYYPAGPDTQLDMFSVVVRTHGEFASSAAVIAAAARTVDPELKLEAASLRDNIQFWMMPARICALLAGALGVLGLVLACIGVYGTTSYAVLRRVREIGIRMTLGATHGQVIGVILRQTMRPVLIGGSVGVVLCAAVSRVLAQLLLGISPLDPLAYGSVALFLFAVGLLATYIPARKAVLVDPVVALRGE